MVYAIANPVSSHLVDKVHHWPGVESLTTIDQDVLLVATKPLRFFDQNNKDLPELLELRFAAGLFSSGVLGEAWLFCLTSRASQSAMWVSAATPGTSFSGCLR
jgi:hypothetical protein